MDVKVRELEARRSDYLRRVQAGEEVVVTLRGRRVARIVAESESAREEESDAELRAGLAKAWRLGRVGAPQLRSLVEDADRDWERLRHINVDARLVKAAGAFAEQHGLRGYVSMHLAAAARISSRVGDSGRVRFFAFDQGLNAAAAKVGMDLVQLD